jgi:glycosyltransferase involved in cell wall biosynthesis
VQCPNIAVVAPNCRNGGSVGAVAWRHALELSRWFRVHVLSISCPEPCGDNLRTLVLRPRRWDGLRRFCHVPNDLAFQWAARRALADLARRVPLSVVWCHGHASAVLAACPLRRRFGFRVVMTTHGDIRDRPPGTYSREMMWYYRLLTPRAYRAADVTHALSPAMSEWALKAGADRRRVVILPNGIDGADIGLTSPVERPPASFLEGGALRLLYVGGLTRLKGVDVLLRAVAASGRGDASLTMVGEGPDEARLRRLAAELGIEERVRFAGSHPRRCLFEFYLRTDILCIPSLSEPLPTVGLEGMLCGLPVVGSRTGGIPSLVEDGENGLLAAPGDAPGLAACIRDLASSRERLAAFGAKGRARALDRFAWPRIAEDLKQIAAGTLPQRR